LCAHNHSSQRVLSGGPEWGCYGLVSVPVLEIVSGGAEHPLDPLFAGLGCICHLAKITRSSAAAELHVVRPTGRPAKRSHASRPIVFTQWSKNGYFAPQGRHVAPMNVKFGTGERTAPIAKFHVYCGKNVGIQPPKLSKFRILAINSCLRGDSFAVFF